MKLPEIKLWKVFVSLGVPGLALGVFYMLMNRFGWETERISAAWSAALAVLFMLLSASVVLYALTLWRPTRSVDRAGQVTLSQFAIDESQSSYKMLHYQPNREICPEGLVCMKIKDGGVATTTIYGRTFRDDEGEEREQYVREFESQRNHYFFGWLRRIGLTPSQVPIVVDEQRDGPQDGYSAEQHFPLFNLAITNDSASQIVVSRAIVRVHYVISVLSAGESETLNPLATYVVPIESRVGKYQVDLVPAVKIAANDSASVNLRLLPKGGNRHPTGKVLIMDIQLYVEGHKIVTPQFMLSFKD